jgi:hypothetical protein
MMAQSCHAFSSSHRGSSDVFQTQHTLGHPWVHLLVHTSTGQTDHKWPESARMKANLVSWVFFNFCSITFFFFLGGTGFDT